MAACEGGQVMPIWLGITYFIAVNISIYLGKYRLPAPAMCFPRIKLFAHGNSSNSLLDMLICHLNYCVTVLISFDLHGRFSLCFENTN